MQMKNIAAKKILIFRNIVCEFTFTLVWLQIKQNFSDKTSLCRPKCFWYIQLSLKNQQINPFDVISADALRFGTPIATYYVNCGIKQCRSEVSSFI